MPAETLHYGEVPLLSTKLTIPDLGTRIERPRLLQKLLGTEYRKLRLITAPPGYGKTTLVTSWLPSLDQSIAWISLDENDNEPLQFAVYLIRALEQADGEPSSVWELLQFPHPPTLHTIVIHLINEICSRHQPVVLVLDDYHVIQNPEIDEAFSYFLANLPGSLQIVLISRHTPGFSLSSIRVRQQMIEEDSNDLRFTLEETQAFFENAARTRFTPDEIAEIEKRTEGWIAGTQLALLGLKDQQNRAEQIRKLSGKNQFIAEYLIDEVLSGQSDEVQRFLLHSSLLRQLNPDLCNHALGIGNAHEMLQKLERENLFIISLDQQQEQYRYHQLFSDLLQSRLRTKFPDEPGKIVARMIDWYQRSFLWEEAIDIAVEAGEFDLAGQMMPVVMREMFLNRVKRPIILKWLKQFPRQMLKKNQDFWITYAFSLIETGNLNQTLAMLDWLWGEPGSFDGMSDEEIDVAKGIQSALRCIIIAQTTIDIPGARQLNDKALQLIPESEKYIRTVASGYSGFFNYLLGDVHAAIGPIERALEILEIINPFNHYVYSNYHAEILAAAGNLDQAAESFRRIFQFAHENNLADYSHFSDTLIGLGRLEYEWGNVGDAFQLLHRGMELAATGSARERYLYAYDGFWLSRNMLEERKDLRSYLDMVQTIAQKYNTPPVVVQRFRAYEARLHLFEGRLTEASAWMEEFLRRQKPITGFNQSEWLIAARTSRAKREYENARRILEELVELADKGGRQRDGISMQDE